MNLIFCMQLNNSFYKLVLSLLVSVASHAQGTQSNKFQKSLYHLKKKVEDEVDFCTDKHQSFQKVGTAIFDGCSQACLNQLK